MAVATVSVRNFRSYQAATAHLDRGLTVVVGPNGAGKTNLLEAVYYGCTGRSCRTANDREVVHFGSQTTRVVVSLDSSTGHHEIAVGFTPGDAKRMTFDGAPVERLLDTPERPLVTVFLPDRLGLIKGQPALRRAHVDHLVAALWPARAVTRRGYAAALAQRNALLARVRNGQAGAQSLGAWDAQLGDLALQLMSDRAEAVERTAPGFCELAALLGLEGEPSLAYRPRSRAAHRAEFVQELEERLEGDLERGYTGHGPHRDELLFKRQGRELRTYGSQGQQRLALLALLLAERELITDLRGTPPLLLLDDVMSELDASRRAALVVLLQERPGQTMITTTDLDHVPGALSGGVARVCVSGSGLLQPMSEAA